MTDHHIPMPTRLQRPQCSCGWTPPLPWRCDWSQFDADACAHLTAVTPGHHHDLDDAAQRCPLCRAGGLPIHRTEAGWPRCSTCDGGGCPDCTDPA